MEDIKTILVLVDKEPIKATKEEIKEVLKHNDGDLERLQDFKDDKIYWGYFAKIKDWFTYSVMDMDKILLFVDDEGEVYSYEHTGNYYPINKGDLKVVGLCDENAELEPIGRID